MSEVPLTPSWEVRTQVFTLGVNAVCYGEQGKKQVVSHNVPFGSADVS